MKTISVTSAEYLNKYKIKVQFDDNCERIIDLEDFFSNHSHPQYNKYKNTHFFKKFKIENGNLVWGKDWDLIFPIYDLYKGNIFL